MRVLAIAVLSVLISGSAFAQTTPSTSDQPAPSGQQPQSDPKQSAPGSTGAMQNAVGGVATSPQDVREQSKGTGPAGNANTSPGTVGATPGDDSSQPKPK